MKTTCRNCGCEITDTERKRNGGVCNRCDDLVKIEVIAFYENHPDGKAFIRDLTIRKVS